MKAIPHHLLIHVLPVLGAELRQITGPKCIITL